MASYLASTSETLVTVFGGSGFLGRNVVRALCKRDYRIRVSVRRPELAVHLQPSGNVCQIPTVQTNFRHSALVGGGVRGYPGVSNLVGILSVTRVPAIDGLHG